MDVIDPGHGYRLNMLDCRATQDPHCWLFFVKREGPNYPGNIGHREGTTTQEVQRACIDRARYVNRQIPCWETRLSIPLMKLVVWLYERRAARRHGRRTPSIREAVYGETCPTCGHTGAHSHQDRVPGQMAHSQ